MRTWSLTIIGRPSRRACLTLIAIALVTVACGGSPTGPSASTPPTGPSAGLAPGSGATPPSNNNPTTDGRTFFVSDAGSDSNPGTRAQPWRTIWHGAAQLGPGDTLYVRGGTYNEREQIRITSSGTASNPITIAGFEEEEVIIYGFPGAEYMISFFDSAAYFVMERLIIDGRGENGIVGTIILAPGSHHIRFKQLEIRNGLSNGIFGGGTDHEFIDLRVHGNGVATGQQNANGLYLTTDSSRVVGGEFYDNACYGVRIFDSGSAESADNNAVTGAKFYGNGYGVGLGRQSVCISGGGGLVLGDVNNRADDNLVYQNLQGILVFGFKRSSGIKVVGNTLRDNISSAIEVQRGAANAELRDNILSGNGTGIVDSGTATIRSNNGPQ